MPQYYQPEPKQQAPVKIKAKHHESYMTMSVLSFLIPAAGFIVGLVYLTKDKIMDRKLGEHMVAFSVLMALVQGFVWMIYLSFVRMDSYL